MGFLAIVLALISGGLYLASIEIPVLLDRGHSLDSQNKDWLFLVVVVGSGVALLLSLLAAGIERRLWPAITAICVLLITENLVFPVMPFWTVMVAGGESGWAALIYVMSLFIALGLIGRRIFKGMI